MLWDDSVHLRGCAHSGFCCPGLLHASVVMLFERQVGVHPDSKLSRCLFSELDNTVSYLYFCCEFRPEVLLVAFPAFEKCVRARTPAFGLIGIRMVIMVYGCKCGLE